MTFDLTESIIDDIIFSMENQNGDFLFNAKDSCIVSTFELLQSEIEELEDEDCLYSLPSWTSGDGFEIMEEFVESVRVPAVRAELSAVLSNGRGVFRNYKDVLKKYPHIEKRFHGFKEARMRSVVVEWYNSLRESWGLEKLSQDFEEYDELVQQDFEFRPYNHQKDSDCVIREAEKIAVEIKEKFSGELGSAVARFWLRRFDYEEPSAVGGVVCRTLSDEFAGCLLFSDCSSFARNVAALTAFFVNQNYRGLGIARELFSRGISGLRERGIQSFIIADSAVPEYVEPLLTRCGFEKIGSVYTAELA